MEALLSGMKSRCHGNSYTAACFLGCLWSARSSAQNFGFLYAALAQSGLSKEREQTCGEETRYNPWTNQVLFLLDT